MIRVTIACPEPLMADANALASVLGLHPDDAHTFFEAKYLDSAANRYAVVSMLASPSFPGTAIGSLVEPEWGADMVAAGRAQSVLAIYETPEEPDEESEPFARPNILAAVISFDVDGALNILGLTREDT